ncbi:unnamed protein product, partial [Discosporangium mesarthrocarpum]
QALLDIRFPDVSHHGQGLHLMTYREDRHPWKKLILWHSVKPTNKAEGSGGAMASQTSGGREGNGDTTNLSSESYMQTYVVMKPTPSSNFAENAMYRDVLFRFGSWCYSGTVQLTPSLSLGDIPHIIPALRMQQSKLDFMCDVSQQMPSKSPFTKPLSCMQQLLPIMEQEVADSEEVLADLLDKLAGMGLEDSVASWFEGDSMQSFFEFQQTAQVPQVDDPFSGVDLVATKSYSARGVVTIGMWFEGTFYTILAEGSEEQPLLDSRFPDVSAKGRGYQIRSVSEGPEGWARLRKVSVWQTAAALQQEMEARMEKARRTGRNASKKVEGAEDTRREGGNQHGASPLELNGSPGERALVPEGSQRLLSTGGGERTRDGAGMGGPGGEGETRNNDIGGGEKAAQPKEPAGRIGGTRVSTDGDVRPAPERSGSKGTKTGEPPETGHKGEAPRSGSKLGADETLVLEAASAKDSRSLVAPVRLEAAKPLTKTKVALPHHLAPMEGLEGKLRKMRVDMGNELGDAPWDNFGRPKTALGAKMPHK